MTTVKVLAPAKINLALHVTGRQPDGYHLLDSLVTFADFGDYVSVAAAAETRLTISGVFSKGLSDTDNLILDAARLIGVRAEIHLEKNLPVASGIGGGSADAAATLVALSKVSGCPLPGIEELATLGADVPACVMGGLLRMRGIGENLERLAPVAPRLPLLLVNPGVPVSTPDVFRALRHRNNDALAGRIPDPQSLNFSAWLRQQRNDLEEPARALVPEIDEVLKALSATDDVELARMSGSGATCFALYKDARSAQRAAAMLRASHSHWWIRTSSCGSPASMDPIR